MANQIVAEYLVKELIEGVKIDDGYSAVCMDGAKNNINDCPAAMERQLNSIGIFDDATGRKLVLDNLSDAFDAPLSAR